jgi:hypothetical protein
VAGPRHPVATVSILPYLYLQIVFSDTLIHGINIKISTREQILKYTVSHTIH